MHWIELDGVTLPKRLGGHPALDFCNTWAGWGDVTEVEDARREWLKSYDVLVAWSVYAGLVSRDDADVLRRRAARRKAEAATVLERARALRVAVHDAVLDPADADALAALTPEVRRAGALVDVVPAGPDADAGADLAVGLEAGLELPVLAAAWSAAGLLSSPDVAKVCACPGIDCGWLFLDTRGRRRWCDMAVCGNRAKVAAHARRARERTA
ncbi:CGNR zinc finger domain-containing protein [Nocardioides iriomotensis]|uniref:CGNR zinc finger domain-containing protein n=1 Tax=Nocardioides iriomotensis TaxID=715784 RepID=UPI0013E9E56A|nr:CGNR zinc finger domain-containing protein [Nocardioides iriomotensis]